MSGQGGSKAPRYPSLSGKVPTTRQEDRRASTNPYRTEEGEEHEDEKESSEEQAGGLQFDLSPEEIEYIQNLRVIGKGKKPEYQKPEYQTSKPKKRTFRFAIPSSTVNIPTLKGASNWDR